jgi:hypothetical protein
VYLTYTNWTEKLKKKIRKRLHIRKTAPLYVIYKIIVTFILVSLTWIFFRASSLTLAIEVIKKIFTSFGTPFYESPANIIYAILGILTLIIVDLKREFFNNGVSLLYNKYSAIRWGTVVAMVMVILFVGVFDGGQFIYFQF